MGSEFLSEEKTQAEFVPPSYIEMFYKAFPQYLVMGMTAEQYWDGDCALTKYYRDAYRLKQEHQNYMAWLQGAYVYDAICAVSPVLHAFAKKGTKVEPYLKTPYNMRTQESNDKKTEKTNSINAMQAKFLNMASKINQKFKSKGGGADADN